MLANACGPCIGQWSRPDEITGQPNTIVNSYNRNFPKRNDGSAKTLSFVTSPDTVMALALSGRLDFDPTIDTLDRRPTAPRSPLEAPVGEVLPDRGYDPGVGHVHGAARGRLGVIDVVVSPTSDRLQLLEPFPAWDGKDYIGLPVLMKAQGKCTTDHISAAGPWLKFRGHLENISGNLFLGVVNAFTGAAGEGKDISRRLDPHVPRDRQALRRGRHPLVRHRRPQLRRGLVARARGDGAPVPRRSRSIFARSFARIHETNAKKQGLVPLTFADRATYDAIGEDDRINVLGLPPVPGENVRCQIVKPDGTTIDFEATHTFSPEQVEWFKAGSALNIVRQKVADGGS